MYSLESIERATKSLLSKGVKEDTPTGSTPRKRKWQYADDWNLTASRHELLRSRSENEVVEQAKVAPSQQRDIENEVQPTETLHISSKVEGIKAEPVPLEPLVDSRRRNVTRTTRRAR
jgi:kinesin family protein 11